MGFRKARSVSEPFEQEVLVTAATNYREREIDRVLVANVAHARMLGAPVKAVEAEKTILLDYTPCASNIRVSLLLSSKDGRKNTAAGAKLRLF